MSMPEYLAPHPTAAADQLRSLANDLERQEAVIDRGLQSFIDIGRALSAIRDERLYRQEYDSFETYCLKRWNLSRKRAYDLMAASTVIDGMEAAMDMAVSPIGDTPPLPSNEGQARELSGLDPAEAVDVMAEVDKTTHGRPTAAAIRESIARRRNVDESADPAVRDNEPDIDAEVELKSALDNRFISADQLDELNHPAPATPSTPAPPRRKALEEQFFHATDRLNGAVETLKKLGVDDRLPRNKEKVARYRNDLLQAIDALQRVADQLT